MLKRTPRMGSLVNTLNHPVYLSYLGETLVLAPKQKVTKVNKEKVGALPTGVLFIPNSK